MSAATKAMPMTAQQRKQSIIESTGNPGPALRSAMIMTSAVTSRDVPPSQIAGFVENTYQLEPDKMPRGHQLQKIIQEVLTEHLSARTYHPALGEATKALAEQMKLRAKALGVPRYKYIALVVLGPVQRTSGAMGSRCVWSTAFDTFGEYTYRNETISATGIIFGVYVE